MSAFKLPGKKPVDQTAIEKFVDGVDEHTTVDDPVVPKRGRRVLVEQETKISLTLKLYPADYDDLNVAFENSKFKSKQQFLEDIVTSAVKKLLAEGGV